MKNKKIIEFDLHPQGSCSARKHETIKKEIIRPKINYLYAFLFIAGHIGAGGIISFIIGLVFYGVNGAADFTLKWLLVFSTALFLLSSRYTLIFFVRLYQRFASENVRGKCNMTPSCSEYAILAFKKYGSIIGLTKTIKRIKRCGGQFEEDYP